MCSSCLSIIHSHSEKKKDNIEKINGEIKSDPLKDLGLTTKTNCVGFATFNFVRLGLGKGQKNPTRLSKKAAC